uniref:Uncharacterized protein n=1 Tax=Pyxicephalus adspersus TaxID=30357 RepID=A0AAV2ZQE3_PYXAD|nr:TPA: hypothetical protein GDO54_017013 [Pyxicephalus adspersus]
MDGELTKLYPNNPEKLEQVKAGDSYSSSNPLIVQWSVKQKYIYLQCLELLLGAVKWPTFGLYIHPQYCAILYKSLEKQDGILISAK